MKQTSKKIMYEVKFCSLFFSEVYEFLCCLSLYTSSCVPNIVNLLHQLNRLLKCIPYKSGLRRSQNKYSSKIHFKYSKYIWLTISEKRGDLWVGWVSGSDMENALTKWEWTHVFTCSNIYFTPSELSRSSFCFL